MNEFWNNAIELICEALRSYLIKQSDKLFEILNVSATEVADSVGRSPKDWSSSVFGIVSSLSENVILPIGGMVLTFVVCYEIISLVLEKNNMHDFDSASLYIILLKMSLGVYVLSHSFEICMALFEVSQYVVNKSGALLQTNGALEVSSQFIENVEMIDNPIELLSMLISLQIMKMIMNFIMIGMSLVLSGRFIEIFCYCSVAPIPFATFLNREWGQMGFNYARGIMALAFQAFFMMICFAVYYGLIANINMVTDITQSLFKTLGYSILLLFALFKTNSWSKSIFNAH